MDAAYDLPVLSAGEEHAGAVDVLEGGACILERGGDECEALVGLLGDIEIVGPDGPCSGDMNLIADANGAGEAR